jgi:virulence-associated protein VagC
MMERGRIFPLGYRQAVRLPKTIKLPFGNVEIYKDGAEMILRPRPTGGRKVKMNLPRRRDSR